MKRFLLALLLAAPVLQSQTPITNPGSGFASILNFETEHTGTTPRGWGGGPPGTIFVDGNIVHSGRWQCGSSAIQQAHKVSPPLRTCYRQILRARLLNGAASFERRT